MRRWIGRIPALHVVTGDAQPVAPTIVTERLRRHIVRPSPAAVPLSLGNRADSVEAVVSVIVLLWDDAPAAAQRHSVDLPQDIAVVVRTVDEWVAGVARHCLIIECELAARPGFDDRARDFSPHLTTGRAKSNKNARELIAQADLFSLPELPLEVRELVLMKSDFYPEGARYSDMARVKLPEG